MKLVKMISRVRIRKTEAEVDRDGYRRCDLEALKTACEAKLDEKSKTLQSPPETASVVTPVLPHRQLALFSIFILPVTN